jgi:cell division protein FtsB
VFIFSMVFESGSGKYFQLKVMLFIVLLVFGWLLFSYAGLVYKGYLIDIKKDWFYAELARLSDENEVLAKKVEYFQTEEFLVREAKRKLNKRESEEQVLVLKDLKVVNESQNVWWYGLSASQVWWQYFFGRGDAYERAEVEILKDR